MKKRNLILLFKIARAHIIVGFVITFYPFFWLFNSSYLITDYVKKLNLELNTIDTKIKNL